VPIQLKVAGAAWHRQGRYGRMIGRSPKGQESLGHCIQKGGQAVDHLKIVNSGLNSLLKFGKETKPQFDIRELTEAVFGIDQV